jgi:hypothetical protein
MAYIVALHCATALALLWFFRADWARIIRGLIASLLPSLRERRLSIQGSDERLAWMIVVATVPVGLTGIALEHTFRTIFAKPTAAAVFLFINGLILLAGERLRRPRPKPACPPRSRPPGDRAAWSQRSGGHSSQMITSVVDAEDAGLVVPAQSRGVLSAMFGVCRRGRRCSGLSSGS